MSESVKVSFTGSSTVTEDLELDEKVVFIVEGTVSKVGEASSQTSGHVPFRSIKVNEVVLAPGDLRAELMSLIIKKRDESAGVQQIDFGDDDDEDDVA